MQRREFIKGISASLVMLSSGLAPSSVANATSASSAKTKKNIVWVILRGALDPLHTIVPLKEPNFSQLRPTLADNVANSKLVLNPQFSLNPVLTNMHQWYLDKQLLPIVAVSSGYPERSHFAGQDFLESGGELKELESGWLGRAISASLDHKNNSAIAISNAIPISLRGSDSVNTWYPTKGEPADEDIYQQLAVLYQQDKKLSQNLMDGISLKEMAMRGGGNKSRKFVALAKACGNFLTQSDEIDCAMLEMGGWDTHSNQHSRLNRQLSQLDKGLEALKSALVNQWQNTVIIVATEFGRTVKENGTYGTDHGTGSAMFIAGGAVKGGKVLGQWPGLKPEQLFQNRDLQPTSNSFSWISTVMQQHWQLTTEEINHILPNNTPYDVPIIS
ncbi:DUF1501 domain-containing protein [Shewanella sp. 5_MG-2023]|uniref:DUF1501 domain-containing protein n=1 Tax=Shewanella sp. 5_MG-2023 TaxID=3062656 RepID=UPI0026E1B554|nr:DUF1501 domain-containing protein [Shewanella sp. 5_MG-2023]MDO6640704.1 DUF1501 domain-containing protein [Shewanella sp. 5_MG-2023]